MEKPSAARDRAVRMKGQGFRGIVRALEALRGADAVRAALAEVPGEAGEALRSGAVVASGWYPLAWYAELHAAIARATRGTPEFARALGREATRSDINLVYRFVLRLLSPNTLVEQLPRVWALYIQGAEIALRNKGERSMRLGFEGMYGANRLVWEDLLGGIEVFVEATGARGVRVRAVEGGREGDANFEVEVFWAE